MSSYKDPDFQQRQSNAAVAKKENLEKHRAASQDPAVADRRAARVAVHQARLLRMAERKTAKALREVELAEQAARATELVLQAQREAEQVEALVAAEKAESQALLEGQQKAARDARYAARKAAKKIRRRGY